MEMSNTEQKKVWWKSKTIMANILWIAAAIIAAVSGEVAAGGTITLMGIVNIGLRISTKEGLKYK